MQRRAFIKQGMGLALFPAGSIIAQPAFTTMPAATKISMLPPVEARYYEKLPHKKIKCVLCPRECVIDDLERGYCGVRENRDGTYYTLVYGNACSANIDPIEKKPLFHFLPGTQAFSIATVGCNVECKFCQNWEISQMRPEQAQNYELPPEEVARIAEQRGSASIAYTYTEPVIFTEYMHDCAQAGQRHGIRSVMISNGFIQAKPMDDLCKVLDAVKIDLKAFRQKFYTELVAGQLQPVLDTLIRLKKNGKWFEIVYLIIPTKNDDPQELKDMCRWVAQELGKDVPVHFSRFYPQYRLKNISPTPAKTMNLAREIGLAEGLHYVYVGNLPGHEAESTFCPGCQQRVIHRMGYSILENKLKNGQCPNCKTKIAGIWK